MEYREMPKAAIFDLDGTLLDSVDLHALAWHEAMAQFGHDISFEQARSQIGKGGDKLIPEFLSDEAQREGAQTALEGADDAGRYAGRMPGHAHDRAERPEPEWMRQPLQEFVAAVVVDDGLSNDGAERRHSGRQPRRNTSAVQG
jgi:beta-phosphoglucomutase-like phosphatase (HAD superfamily)